MIRGIKYAIVALGWRRRKKKNRSEGPYRDLRRHARFLKQLRFASAATRARRREADVPNSAAVPDGHTTVSLIVPRDVLIPLAFVVATYLSLFNTESALTQFRLLPDISGVETFTIFRHFCTSGYIRKRLLCPIFVQVAQVVEAGLPCVQLPCTTVDEFFSIILHENLNRSRWNSIKFSIKQV